MTEKIESDFKTNFENVKINYIKCKMLQLFIKTFKIKLDDKFYHFDLS